MSDSFSLKKILKVVSINEKKIQTKGKKIIIFIAVSQTGKTTTINVLKTGKANINDDGECIFNNSSDLGATGGAAGVSCTILPRVYNIEDLCFLDIQGYNDTRSNITVDGVDLNREEIQVVASILTEMAIKLTSGISAILLLKYGDFSFKGMQESGEMINRLFNNIKLPIFILFNRFSHKSKNVMKAYYQTDGKEEIDFVKKQVINQANAMEKEKSNASFTEYFDLIKMNIDNNNFSYIDIEDQLIIDEIKSRVHNLPSINKDQIKFDNSSSLRVKFNQLCKNMLDDWLNYLKRKYFMNIYSPKFFKEALNDIPQKISTLKAKLSGMAENKDFDTQNEINFYFDNLIKNQKDEKKRKEDDKKIADDKVTEYDKEKKKYEKDVNELNGKKSTVEDQIKDKQKEKPEEITNDGEVIEDPTSKIIEIKSQMSIYTNQLDKYDNDDDEYIKDEETFNNDSYFINNTYTYKYNKSYSRVDEILGKDVVIKSHDVRPKDSYYWAKFEAQALFHPEMKVTIKFYGNNSIKYEDIISDYKSKKKDCETKLEALYEKQAKYAEKLKKSQGIETYKTQMESLETTKSGFIKEINEKTKARDKVDQQIKDEQKKSDDNKKKIEQLEKDIKKAEDDKSNALLLFSAIQCFKTAKTKLDEKKKKVEEFQNENKKIDDKNILEEIQSCINICIKLDVNKDVINDIETYKNKIDELKSKDIFSFTVNQETVRDLTYTKNIVFQQNEINYDPNSFSNKFDGDLKNVNITEKRK